MKKTWIFASIACVLPHPAMAMSFQDAGENLLYFQHAKLSAEYCERRGVAVQAAYFSWQSRENPILVQSTEAARVEAKRLGLSKAEQDSIVAESLENLRGIAQGHIEKKGVDCARFGSVLKMYTDLLKR